MVDITNSALLYFTHKHDQLALSTMGTERRRDDTFSKALWLQNPSQYKTLGTLLAGQWNDSEGVFHFQNPSQDWHLL